MPPRDQQRPIQWTHPDGRTWDRALPERKVGTLGNQVQRGHCLTIFCLACQRSTPMLPAQVAALAGKHGSDLALSALLDRSVCKVCGARWPWLDLSISPYTHPAGGRVVVPMEESAETASVPPRTRPRPGR